MIAAASSLGFAEARWLFINARRKRRALEVFAKTRPISKRRDETAIFPARLSILLSRTSSHAAQIRRRVLFNDAGGTLMAEACCRGLRRTSASRRWSRRLAELREMPPRHL